jgi:pyruvate/2-oxoglutarate dehydrogenase complex dihydrolipoamide acyltransferase (E2) component
MNILRPLLPKLVFRVGTAVEATDASDTPNEAIQQLILGNAQLRAQIEGLLNRAFPETRPPGSNVSARNVPENTLPFANPETILNFLVCFYGTKVTKDCEVIMGVPTWFYYYELKENAVITASPCYLAVLNTILGLANIAPINPDDRNLCNELAALHVAQMPDGQAPPAPAPAPAAPPAPVAPAANAAANAARQAAANAAAANAARQAAAAANAARQAANAANAATRNRGREVFRQAADAAAARPRADSVDPPTIQAAAGNLRTYVEGDEYKTWVETIEGPNRASVKTAIKNFLGGPTKIYFRQLQGLLDETNAPAELRRIMGGVQAGGRRTRGRKNRRRRGTRRH